MQQMLDVSLVLAGSACWAIAALAGAAARERERGFVAFGLLGALLGFAGGLHALLGGVPSVLGFSFWGMPARLEVDALSAAFLLPLHLVAGLGVLYGRSYWPLGAARGSGRPLRAQLALLACAMGLVLVARQGLVFLVAWEAMAVSAFLLISTEHERPEVRKAGWVYLLCTHTGTLALVALVAVLARRGGSLLWLPLPAPGSPGLDGAILALAIFGFGFKAGFLPLHFWLPEAHAGAPSHVSAILSAVMLKAGVYGILRVTSLLPTLPGSLGGLLLALGAATALYGVGYALAQRDYKKLLAYSSIENLGVIAMGLGLGFCGRAAGDGRMAALGFGGAIFHVWNHAAFKTLLFYGAGSVLHATGSRDLEALGGLGARMPRTALILLPAVLAVSALPPFNAFLSEWFLYRGLFAAVGQGWPWSAALALPALALTGGLALLAFSKFYGILFLGEPRSEAAGHAHDPGSGMLRPMAFLALLCLALGLGSPLLLPLLDRVVAVLAPGGDFRLAQGLDGELRLMSALFALLLLLVLALLRWSRRIPGAGPDELRRPPTWDCGYAAPSARMQYSAGSFAAGWAFALPGLRARLRRIRTLFPTGHSFHSQLLDPVGDLLVGAWAERLGDRLLRFRRLQPGFLSIYLLYVLLALLAVFLWLLARPRLLG